MGSRDTMAAPLPERLAWRRARALAAVLAIGLGLLVAPTGLRAARAEEPSFEDLAARENETRAELAGIDAAIALSTETVARLDKEIVDLAEDQTRVQAAMIEAAARQSALSREVVLREDRIVALAADEDGVRTSLHGRRGVLAEVLAALQRMGRKPPPAVLVKPDDALGAVRSAILLGAVVPRMRAETDRLLLELAELARLRLAIEAEKRELAATIGRQREEEAFLVRLFDEKRRLEASRSAERLAEAARAAELADRAGTLNDLIASLETDLNVARLRQEEEARRTAEAAAARERETAERLAAEAERAAAESAVAAAPPPAVEEPAQPAYDLASLRSNMTTLEPDAAFSTLKGILTRPVAGGVASRFGESGEAGTPSTGMTFEARSGDVVVAPADGRVLFSGPFRSYGELLILNVGDGYHVVLAGMERIDAEVGQFVLAGEPVAAMAARRLASAGGSDVPATGPSLYVEFRKNGKPVDPSPWWAEGPPGRTGNDT